MTAARFAAAGVLAAAALACRKHEPAPPVEARACLIIDTPPAPVGFDAPFSITARLTCGLAGGSVAWRQIEGPPVRERAPAHDGFSVTARMPPLADATGGPIPWGVVPLSPRTRGEIVLRATWSDDHGRTQTTDARVAAADRSRGLPNTPVGVRVYLGGAGWHVTARPADSHATLDVGDGATSLLPDVSGDWRLADGGGRALALRAGRYDETPLDCGRAGCHPAITDAVAVSPMTTVLARLMDRRPQADYPSCALACHATGEPGAHDGGFAHAVSELGAAGDLNRRWNELPRDLHRLGGVGCLACHGPGAIPEASARWAVLRTDLCATCHDAPPRYGHVVAWSQTRMARADRDPSTRERALCVPCHTTWGFLATINRGTLSGFPNPPAMLRGEQSSPAPHAIATPERKPVDRRPPEDVGPVGITCSACHAVHDPRQPRGTTRLLRATPKPALLAEAASAAEVPNSVCLPCHTPDPLDETPSASTAALVFGRGGLDPVTGKPLMGAAPQAAVPGGCVGCHRSGPENVERGAGHAFRAPRALPSNDIRARAENLWRALRGSEYEGPAHAGRAGAITADRRTPRGRAIWNLLLVLEDRAADAHNAPYARALLDAAEAVLNKRSAR
ncbi:MAG TPA: hypothetical protein VN903_24800 [Polyangia bacterium]|nr:hypothetical protein [Polyangia bacterium]